MNDRQQQLISCCVSVGVIAFKIWRWNLVSVSERFAGILKNSHLLTQSRLSVADMAVGSGCRLVLSGPAKTDSQTNSAAQTPSYWAAW